MKQIILLGDSIRMGYEPHVRKALEGRAEVYGPNENGRWAGYTLNSLRFWLPQLPKEPDVIHWNNGLWDLGDDYHLGRPFSLPEEYISALERMITVLEKTFPTAKIVMATTTPTANGDNEGIRSYNDILKSVAAKHGFAVDDLYPIIAADIPRFVCPDKIHLTADGWAAATAQVVANIEPYL